MCGGGLPGDLMIADYEDVQESEASGINVRKIWEARKYSKQEHTSLRVQAEHWDFLIVQDRHR